MIILLTGTPGVGKTVVAKRFSEKYGFKYFDLNEYSKKFIIAYDESRDTNIVDIDKLRNEIYKEIDPSMNYIIDGHISHFLNGDFVIVLRLNPEILYERLLSRGYNLRKILENMESEILDVCLSESIEIHGMDKVFEIDVTGKDVEDICDTIYRIINEENFRKKYIPGKIDWLENYYHLIEKLRRELGGD